MNGRQVPYALRAIAWAIVLLAILDPAITSTRRSDGWVAVVPASAHSDPERVARVMRALEAYTQVVRGPFPGAAATVVVGDRLPERAVRLPGHVFQVVPESMPSVRIASVELPRRGSVDARVPVLVGLDANSAFGRVTLRSGDLVLDRREVRPGGVPLSFVPPDTGTLHLRVEVEVDGWGPVGPVEFVDRAFRAEAVEPWRIFFFDPRPSWGSTFARRAIETDPRFDVRGRVITAPGLSTIFGADTPAGTADPDLLAPFDAVVVGAPELLGSADIEGLRAYLRRGGSVVFLPESPASGSWTGLIGGRLQWSSASSEDPRAITPRADDAASRTFLPIRLEARELAWPATLPPGMRVLAGVEASAEFRPIIWEKPVGLGNIIVNGALDAWRLRDPDTGHHEESWRAILAHAAALARPSPDIETDPPGGVVPPGTRVAVRVHGVAGDGGVIKGAIRAPTEPGTHSVFLPIANNFGELGVIEERIELPLVVATDATPRPREEYLLLAGWVAGRGGAVIAESDLRSLPTVIAERVESEHARERRHPMRSAWWIVPFAFALAGEWWWRRRRGLA